MIKQRRKGNQGRAPFKECTHPLTTTFININYGRDGLRNPYSNNHKEHKRLRQTH